MPKICSGHLRSICPGQDDLYIVDEPDPRHTVILEENTQPLDIFSLFFMDDFTDNIVMWAKSNHKRKFDWIPTKTEEN